MFGAKKGKACIISVTNFGSATPVSLDGYRTDEKKLKQLWHQIGFDVYVPKASTLSGPTAMVGLSIH